MDAEQIAPRMQGFLQVFHAFPAARFLAGRQVVRMLVIITGLSPAIQVQIEFFHPGFMICLQLMFALFKRGKPIVLLGIARIEERGFRIHMGLDPQMHEPAADQLLHGSYAGRFLFQCRCQTILKYISPIDLCQSIVVAGGTEGIAKDSPVVHLPQARLPPGRDRRPAWSLMDGPDPAKQILIDELEAAGFEVTAPDDYYEMEMKNSSRFNRFRAMTHENTGEFRRNCDLVLVAVNMKGYAKENNTRLSYSVSHSGEIPWYTHEVPTVAVSLNYTNHLIDLPMMKTYINAFGSTREYIHALVEKLTGKSEFRGRSSDLVFCGRWDTRL